VPAGQSADAAVSDEVIQDAAAMFAMLSATVRLHILWLLSLGARDVGTLAEETGQTMATVSHHLGKLKLGGFVSARRDGRRQVYVTSNALSADLVRIAIGDRAPKPTATLRSADAG
jgi:DNA-binding transcriptional ArsR family regulator